MAFRLVGIGVLAAVLIAGSGFVGAVCADRNSAATHSVDPTAKARFVVRIREMLAEAARLESAGRRNDAIQITVRASRMLAVIGGEPAWPKGGISPARYLAHLTRHGLSDVAASRGSTRPARAAAVPEPVPGIPVVGRKVTPDAVSPGESLPAASEPPPSSVTAKTASHPPAIARKTKPGTTGRFPELPARSRSWVPLGESAGAGDRWKPFGESPPDSKSIPMSTPGPGAAASDPQPQRVLPASVEFPLPTESVPEPDSPVPIPVFEPPEATASPAGAGSKTNGISDNRVGPIPIHIIPPARPEPTAIDIRADEAPDWATPSQAVPAGRLPNGAAAATAPHEMPLETLPAPASLPQEKTGAGSEAETAAGFTGKADDGRTDQGQGKASGSQLFFATIVGAVGGVLLLLAGTFLLRRFTGLQIGLVVKSDAGHEETSGRVEQLSPGGEIEVDDNAKNDAAKDAAVADDPAAESVAAGSAVTWTPGSSWVDAVADSVDESATSTQLQIFRGSQETAEVASPETAESQNANPPVTPAVPFRVIGTDVVLGEAESARVDDELERRRQAILKAVFEENSTIQNRLNGIEEESQEAA